MHAVASTHRPHARNPRWLDSVSEADTRPPASFPHHGAAEVPPSSERELATIAETTGELQLATLWEMLVSGEVQIVQAFCSPSRCFAILRKRPSSGAARSVVSSRDLRIFTRVLLGEPQKVIGFELKLSPSSITSAASACARAMGVESRARRVPMLLLLAAAAAEDGNIAATARVGPFVYRGVEYQVVSTVRPDPGIWPELTPSERDIIMLLAERRTNAEIAAERSTSIRTVANQLATIMRKLGSNSRTHVLSKLVKEWLPRIPDGNSSHFSTAAV